MVFKSLFHFSSSCMYFSLSPSLSLLLWRCQSILRQFVRTSAWKLEQRITHVTRLAWKHRRQRHWLKMTRGVSPCQGERNGSLESTPPKSLGDERPVQHLLTVASEHGCWEGVFAFVSTVCSFLILCVCCLPGICSVPSSAFFFLKKKLSRAGFLLDISTFL